MKEVWKYINGFDGLYEISNLGRVKTHQPRYKTDRILKPGLATMGYLTVCLKAKDKDRRSHFIHKLLAHHFIANPENKRCVNHKDGNKVNNSLDNLEWVTHGENNSHAIRTGLKKSIHHARGVIQMDMEGNELARYHSSEHVPGMKSGNICHVANGKRTHHKGFKYKWINHHL